MPKSCQGFKKWGLMADLGKIEEKKKKIDDKAI